MQCGKDPGGGVSGRCWPEELEKSALCTPSNV